MYPFLYPFVQRPCLHDLWTLMDPLPLKHAEASRCGMPFSRSHGTERHGPNPAVSKDGPRSSSFSLPAIHDWQVWIRS